MSNPFDLFPQEYDSWFDRYPKVFESEVVLFRRLLDGEIPENSLEIGVGTGRFAKALGIRFGVDPAERALKLAQRRGIAVVKGVGEDLPFRDSAFELVLINTVLCFCRDPSRLLAESRRVVKSGGRLVVGFIERESTLGRLYSEKGGRFFSVARLLSFREVEEGIVKAGFRIQRVMQTLFGELSPDRFEEPEPGWGRGSFIGIVASA